MMHAQVMDKILGYIGCTLMSIQGLPQLWRVYTTKSGEDLSYTTLALGCVGGGITVAYGVMIKEPPLYATVSFTVIVNMLVMGLKFVYKRRAPCVTMV